MIYIDNEEVKKINYNLTGLQRSHMEEMISNHYTGYTGYLLIQSEEQVHGGDCTIHVCFKPEETVTVMVTDTEEHLKQLVNYLVELNDHARCKNADPAIRQHPTNGYSTQLEFMLQ